MKEKFLKAAEIGNIVEINNLLNQGVNINSRDRLGRTATMIATYANDIKTVNALIEKGADVNIHIQYDVPDIEICTVRDK